MGKGLRGYVIRSAHRAGRMVDSRHLVGIRIAWSAGPHAMALGAVKKRPLD